MTDRGKYVMVRGWMDHPFFKPEPYTEREAFEWMIGEAAYESTQVRIHRAVFVVERGQLVHARRFLATKWQWEESRVRRFLQRLRAQVMIDLKTSSESTIITICNYDDYQFGRPARDPPATSPRPREEELKEAKNLSGGDTRARDHRPMISREAFDFADELAVIAGHDLKFIAPQWVGSQPAMRVQMMLDSGWRVDVMRDAATAVMRKRSDAEPVGTIRYFEKIFARAHAPQLPLPTVQVVATSGSEPNEIPRTNRQNNPGKISSFASYALHHATRAAGKTG